MSGVLGIWHDVVPGTEAAVEEWYDREHHAERIGIAGFRRARRYRGLEGAPLVFGRYDVDGPGVLQSPHYLRVLANPSDWTRRMMPLYRRMSRAVFRVESRIGRADGGFVASFRIGDAATFDAALALLPGVVAQRHVLGAEAWSADPAATRPAVSREVELRGAPDAMVAAAIIVDGTEPAALRDAVAALRAALPRAESGLHQLVFSLSSGGAT